MNILIITSERPLPPTETNTYDTVEYMGIGAGICGKSYDKIFINVSPLEITEKNRDWICHLFTRLNPPPAVVENKAFTK